MFDFIAEILAVVIRPIYGLVQNYGWTIIIFTVLIKLLTLPFSIKSQKSMAKMQQVQPLISAVQKKYANNKEKQQQELMKIYEKYHISPTGGCLPLLFQMIVLMGFIQIVYRPVTFILQIPKAEITEAITELGLKASDFMSSQLEIFNNPALMARLGINDGGLNFNFLGIDLTKALSKNMTDIVCWILPLIALGLTILSTVITQRQAVSRQNPDAKNDEKMQQTQSMNKMMYVLMPVMTIWITYQWPLGCALYWAISTLTQIAQQIFIQKFIVDKMPPIELKPNKKKNKPKALDNDVEKIDYEDAVDVEEAEESEEKEENNKGMSARQRKLMEMDEDFAPKKNNSVSTKSVKKIQTKTVKPEETEKESADLKDIVKKLKNDKN